MNAFFIQLRLSPQDLTVYVRKSSILSVVALDTKEETAGRKPRSRVFVGVGPADYIDVSEGATLIVPQL